KPTGKAVIDFESAQGKESLHSRPRVAEALAEAQAT
ncbi:hypothetical protein MNBD_BACTEROID06-1621, partial [hydrothermal vent metagenome]